MRRATSAGSQATGDGATLGPPDDPRDKVIRPALFVLFRIAIGPSADYYGPRFLAFERAGKPHAGWHWPALFAPAVWAFYRKLWIAGLVFALLPLAGAHAMALIAPWLDDFTLMWFACAMLLTIVLPSVSGAALANALLYRRVRRRIRTAEARANSPSQAATSRGRHRAGVAVRRASCSARSPLRCWSAASDRCWSRPTTITRSGSKSARRSSVLRRSRSRSRIRGLHFSAGRDLRRRWRFRRAPARCCSTRSSSIPSTGRVKLDVGSVDSRARRQGDPSRACRRRRRACALVLRAGRDPGPLPPAGLPQGVALVYGRRRRPSRRHSAAHAWQGTCNRIGKAVRPTPRTLRLDLAVRGTHGGFDEVDPRSHVQLHA